MSWNVNGLRSAHKKGFMDYLASSEAFLIGTQEVRAHPDELHPELRTPAGWHTHFAHADRKGYSGVGLFSRQKPDTLETSLLDPAFDCEGRVQIATFGKLKVVNCYFPNGSGKNRDNSRVPFKLSFYAKLFNLLETEKHDGRPILVLGDFNIAHLPIDLARPKQNEGTSGFLPEERAEFSRWIESGWVDTFRHFEKSPHHYSWWSQRQGARQRNIGWRIDYVLASPHAMHYVQNAFILPHVMGSDHCPVGVDVDAAIIE